MANMLDLSELDEKTKLHETTDASVWAEEFLRTFPDCGIDEGTMIGWFANAMMAKADTKYPKDLGGHVVQYDEDVYAWLDETGNVGGVASTEADAREALDRYAHLLDPAETPDTFDTPAAAQILWHAYEDAMKREATAATAMFMEQDMSARAAGSLVAHALVSAAWSVASAGTVYDGVKPSKERFRNMVGHTLARYE